MNSYLSLAKYEMDKLNKKVNDISKAIGDQMKKSKGKANVDKEKAESKEVGIEIEKQKQVVKDLEAEIAKKLGTIGNIVADDVVISKDEANNEVVRTWGTKSDIVVNGEELGKLHHHEIMACLDILEMK